MPEKPNILFTTPVLKHPAIGGPFLRIENSIKALSRISDLTIHCRTPISRSEIEYYQLFCRNFYCAPSIGLFNRQITRTKRIVNRFSGNLIKKEIFIPDEKDYADLLRLADTLHPDLIWLGYGNISYPLLKYIKDHSDYPVVCDTDSVWSRFIMRGLPFARSESDRKRILSEGNAKAVEERWGTRLADITTAVSEIDADYYRPLAEKPEQIQVFSNVIDLNDYTKIPPEPAHFQRPCIYLAGWFGPKSPMDEAARWMIEKVMPLVKTQIPDIHFYIVGNGSDTTLHDISDPSVIITGQLPSVLPYLCHADVAVVPLKFESGTRFKILEAGACKIPVVSTTLGAEGIPVTHNVNIVLADDPESFARGIISLLSDPNAARQMGHRLHALIEEKYGLATLISEGNTIIESVMHK